MSVKLCEKYSNVVQHTEIQHKDLKKMQENIIIIILYGQFNLNSPMKNENNFNKNIHRQLLCNLYANTKLEKNVIAHL